MGDNSPIPVVILGGYLGAGKTTLINHCLQNGLSNAAIIVNDFGDINVDAALISQYSSDTLELTNGCICCSIGNSLADTLFSILDRPRRPDVIVIETSGVSDPSAVAAYTHIKGLTSAGIVVLVDALHATSTFSQPLLRKSFEWQIKSAHLLAVTKGDAASEADLTSVRQLLKELAPDTPVVEANTGTLTYLIDAPPTINVAERSPLTDDHPLRRSLHVFDDPITENELMEFIASLDSTVIRAKGIVELLDGSRRLVQKTGPHASVTQSDLPATGLVLLAIQQ